MWLIEEKVSNIRTRTWINPSKLPRTREDKIAKNTILILKNEKKSQVNKMKSGFNFWTVNKINKTAHLKDSTILGTQAWKGAAPNLIKIATKNKKLTKSLKPFSKGDNTKLKRKITEAKAWVKKYLIEESLKPLELFKSKRGIKARVLTSRPTQHKIKEEEEETNIKLKKIATKNKKLEGVNQIGEEIKSIVGAWAQKLNLAYLSECNGRTFKH